MDAVKIGEFLKALIKSKGYTQQEVAEALYVTQKTVSRWENGEGIPDINIIVSVAEFYDVTVDELLKGERQIKEQAEYTIKQKSKSKFKLIDNKLSSKQNKFFIVSTSVICFFFMLGLILGLLVSEIAALIIIPFGLLIGLGIYIFGITEINKIINDEDLDELKEDLEKAKINLKKKNLLFSDIFFISIILTLLLALLFYMV